MIDERILQELKRRRGLIIRNIERYKAEKARLLGRQHYYDYEVQRFLDGEKKEKNFERVDFIEKRLAELERKVRKINRTLIWVNEQKLKQEKTEKKSNETKFLIVFLALLAITGIFLFSDYLKLEFGPTGFVLSRGVSNATAHEVQSVIGGNVTIEIRLADHIPNDTIVDVTFNGNQTNQTDLEYFLYANSCDANSTDGIAFNDVDAVRAWEGIVGYGYDFNDTFAGDCDGGNFTVDLDALFPTGLIAPSLGGVYDLILNATFQNTSGDLVVTSTTPIEVGNWLDVNLTIPDPGAGVNMTPQNQNFTINATLTCQGISGGSCGDVNGTARYNETGSTPDTEINNTDGATPFFTLDVNSQNCGSPLLQGQACSVLWTVNATGTGAYEIDVNFTSNDTDIRMQGNETLDVTIFINATPTTPDLNLPANNTQIGTDVLTVELNWSNSTDADNDAIKYYLEIWNDTTETNIMYVNSSISESTNTTSDLVTFPNETKDYFWWVLATDGESNSSFSVLNNISIRVTAANTAPNDPIGVIINSTTADQLNQTNETLDMNFLCDDPEANTMNWNLLSFRDGIEQFTLKGTCTDNQYSVVKLEDANTTVGQLWSFGVVIDDGTLNNTGGYQYSQNITIENIKPSINDVSLAGQSWSPVDGDIRIIEVSFLADDIDGADHLDNSTSLVNVSYQSLTGAGLLSNSNSSCSAATIDSDTNNYTCEVSMQYFWDHATVWTVDAEISDINSSFALNSSNKDDGLNWTYSELVAFNLSSTSLSWASTFPADTNKTSTTNQTVENTGNSLSLDFRTSIIDLGASGTATYIPAGNFSVFNITNTDSIECLFKNQTAAVTPGVEPLVGINNTNIFPLTKTTRRSGGSSNFANLNYCLFDVPADLVTAEYNTSFGGSWDITGVDSGE